MQNLKMSEKQKGPCYLPLVISDIQEMFLSLFRAVFRGHAKSDLNIIINPKKLETGLRTISAGIPSTLVFRIEAIEFPTFGLLPWLVLREALFLCN